MNAAAVAIIILFFMVLFLLLRSLPDRQGLLNEFNRYLLPKTPGFEKRRSPTKLHVGQLMNMGGGIVPRLPHSSVLFS
jgi:hypothetical protein